MKHKTLFKKKSSGQVRQWDVKVEGSKVVASYGVVGGKITEKVTQCKAKNIGRANETSPETQAVLEAEAMHKKQMDRECYVLNLSDPAPYVQPMLALDATKVGHRIQWDTGQFGQPKLDGLRGFHVESNVGKVQSRKGTFYKLPHLYDQLEELRSRMGLPKDDLYLDGEVYKMGIPLGKINGASKKPNDLTPNMEFHVFDLACDSLAYVERREILNSVTEELLHKWGLDKLVIVQSVPLQKAEMDSLHDQFVMGGYEGLMIRGAESLYGFDERSDGLFKYKKFEEEEFDVLDINPDKDGQAVITYKSSKGHHPDKPTFASRPRGTDAYRRYLVANSSKYIGKKGTVRYFELTEYGIPQFPVTVVLDPDK